MCIYRMPALHRHWAGALILLKTSIQSAVLLLMDLKNENRIICMHIPHLNSECSRLWVQDAVLSGNIWQRRGEDCWLFNLVFLPTQTCESIIIAEFIQHILRAWHCSKYFPNLTYSISSPGTSVKCRNSGAPQTQWLRICILERFGCSLKFQRYFSAIYDLIKFP